MRYKDYKKVDIPWLNEVPSHWDIERAKFYIYSKKEINKDKKIMNVLSLTLNGVIRNDADNPIGLSPSDYATYQIFNDNDLVFKLIDLNNIRTSRVGLVNELGIMSSAYIRGIIDNNILCPKYIYYWYYKLYLEEVYNKLGSGVRSTLSSSELLELEIPIPPKEEQEQIARFLDWKINEIDRLIKKKKNKIKSFRNLQGVFLDYNFGKIIKSNTIQENRHSKSFVKIKYLAKIITQKSEKKERFIGLENVQSKSGKMLTSYYDLLISTEGINVRKGMVIFGKLRPYLTKVYVAEENVSCSSEFLVLDCGEKINNEFLKYIMLSPIFIDFVDSSTYGSKMPRANSDFITSIKIKELTIDEQLMLVNKANLYFSKSEKYIQNLEEQIQKLNQLKQSIISDVVTGKVDVRNIKIPAYKKAENIEENIQEEV